MRSSVRTVAIVVGSLMGAFVISLAVSGAVSISAQEKPPAPPAAPTLTVEEQKDREILTLRAQLTSAYKTIADLQGAAGACQAQLGAYQFEQNRQAFDADKRGLKERVETRTGYAWDPDSGKFGEKKPAESPKKE